MESKKILMATMSMGIGGAETHILELSKALVRRGHRVTVASNGGVYVDELLAAGVGHEVIPMHRRSVMTLVKSYFALRKLIRRGGVDVVHAHARIPGFLSGLVCGRRKGPAFVTTAHGMFATGGLAGLLSNWGEKTIAVSEDLRNYLIEEYGIAAENIFTTVNGIDMERFSPAISGAEVRGELGIPDGVPLVLHVSRLDESAGVVAEQLIGVAEALARAVPDIHLVIVGGGDQLERLKGLAEAVNAAAGRKITHMTGPRTDVGACLAASDLFVGVSRAALEAMSAGRPVVLAGQQGYAGIFGADKLQLSQDTNFCYRGSALPTEADLLRDIPAVLAMDGAAREALGAYGREVVEQFYSVDRMVEDTLLAYEALVPEKQILVSGYYGFNNAGDEAILDALIQSIRGLDMPTRITVLSNTPELTTKKHGVAAVNRFSFRAVFRAVGRTDLLISGGGSLLQDKSSTRSILYYLFIIRLAKLRRKPVMLYANGIGPVSRPFNRRLMKRVISRVDVITLREESSRDELVNMGVTGREIHVTADPIFLLRSADVEGAAEAALRGAGVPADKPLVGISVRSLRTGENFVEEMAKFGDRISEARGVAVVFIAMQAPHDVNLSREIMGRMKQPAYLLDSDLPPEAFIGATGRMGLVVAMRLHTMLFAAKAKTPVIGLICDPKIEYFAEKLAQPNAGPVEDFAADQLLALVDTVLDQREAYRDRLAQAVGEMDAGAAENGRLLDELLRRI